MDLVLCMACITVELNVDLVPCMACVTGELNGGLGSMHGMCHRGVEW